MKGLEGIWVEIIEVKVKSGIAGSVKVGWRAAYELSANGLAVDANKGINTPTTVHSGNLYQILCDMR